MADISQLLANAAKTDANFDFGRINRSYWQGMDQAFKQEGRDLFREGVPRNADGSINYGAMRDALFRRGDVATGSAIDNLDISRQQLRLGQDVAGKLGAIEGGPQPAPQIVSPPSANRSGDTPVAPPLNRGGSQAPGASGDQPGSIVGMVSASGVPEELAGPIIAQVSAFTKTDPNAPVDPSMAPRVQQVVQAAAARLRGGGQPTVAQPAPVPAPQAVAGPAIAPAAPQAGSDVQKRIGMYTAIAGNPAYPKSVQDAAKIRLEALQKTIEPTPDMKNAAASGKSLEDYQSAGDERTTQREILTKSLLPRLDKSQEKASAARDEVAAIHRAREQLDAPGGIFSGTAADVQKNLAKVGKFFGIPNDKIANTETFSAAMGERVLSLVKGLGAGTSISNADRDFAADMAGGNIKLDEKSIRRILDIGERAARERIAQHNLTVDKMVGANEALQPSRGAYLVQALGDYKRSIANIPAPAIEALKNDPKKRSQFDLKYGAGAAAAVLR